MAKSYATADEAYDELLVLEHFEGLEDPCQPG